MTTLIYKGYQGSVEADFEDGVLHGQLLFVNDLISYEGATVPEIKAEFESAVDDYLATCARLGKSPNKPFSGVFNVRTGADLHRAAALKASSEGKSLNNLVVSAIQRYVEEPQVQNHVHKHKHEHEHVVVPQGPQGVSITADQAQWQTFSMSSSDDNNTRHPKH